MEYDQADHLVLYMRPKYLLRWKRIVLIPERPAFLYGSKDDKVFGTRVGQGTKLRIVSPGPPDHRPVLVATMKVESLSRIEHGRTYPELDIEPDILGRFVKDQGMVRHDGYAVDRNLVAAVRRARVEPDL